MIVCFVEKKALKDCERIVPGLTFSDHSSQQRPVSLTISHIRGLVHRLLRDMHVQERSLKNVFEYFQNLA